MSPNLNAYAKQFVRAIKDNASNQMIFIGRASLRHAIAEYIDHYHGGRNHQS
jgi:Integrase core domain